MATDLTFPLRDLLTAVVNGEATQPQLAELNRLCQRIALTYLRGRISAGKINPSVLGLNDRDLSLDCVAELFSPSPDGGFSEFIDYFTGRSIDISTTPERLLLVHLRRLVFYICNDGIFRIYGEADPSLSRIIRNIKLGLKRSPSLEMVTRFDEQLIIPRSAAPGAGLTVMTHDEVQRLVDGHLDARTGIPDMLRNIAGEVQGGTPPPRAIPLTILACSVRQTYSRLNIHDTAADSDPMFVNDVLSIIQDACNHVSAFWGSKYIRKGKVCRATLEGYFAGIRKLLEAEFLGRTDGDTRYFDFFTAALPEVSRDEYASDHRSVFEYLAKQARTKASRALRDLEF